MKSPITFGIWAIAIGAIVAATSIIVLKPQDRAIVAPGSVTNQQIVENQTKIAHAFTPPPIIILGNQSSDEVIHLVLGGATKMDQRAYAFARQLQRSNSEVALNIIPAYDEQNIMYKAYEWALMAPKNSQSQSDYIDSIMSISGDISTQALSVAAQNAQINVNDTSATQEEHITQMLSQANEILPPSLPAIWINNSWLMGDDINEDNLNLKSTSSTGVDRVLVTKAYAYATPPNPKVASIFFTIRNMGDKDITIIAAQSPVADKIEIHNHFHENGAMMMREVGEFIVQAGQSVSLEPTGLHLMLYELPAPLAVGQTFPLTLTTKGGAEISTLVKVTPIGQTLTTSDKIE